jgi:hypothetical protein
MGGENHRETRSYRLAIPRAPAALPASRQRAGGSPILARFVPRPPSAPVRLPATNLGRAAPVAGKYNLHTPAPSNRREEVSKATPKVSLELARPNTLAACRLSYAPQGGPPHILHPVVTRNYTKVLDTDSNV